MEQRVSVTVDGQAGEILQNNILAQACAGGAYARYFVLHAADGSTVSAEAMPVSVNADPSRGGEVSAHYSATAVCPSKTYTAVSLGRTADGENAALTMSVRFTGNGEAAELCARIAFRLADGDGAATLCGGDNALVRALLGCAALPALTLAWGDCDYAALPLRRTESALSGFVPAVATFADGGLRIASAQATFGREVIAAAANKPVLRALRPYTRKITTAAGTADGGGVSIGQNVEALVSASVDGTTLLRTDVCRIPTIAAAVYDEEVRDLGAAGELVSDPGEEYVALVTASYVEVYRALSPGLQLLTRVPRPNNERVYLFRGGSMALWMDLDITVYERQDDDTYTSFTATSNCGNVSLIVREGDAYHLACRRASLFQRNKLTRDGTVTGLGSERIITASFMLGQCGDTVVFGYNALKARAMDVDVSDEFGCTAMATSATRPASGAGNGFWVCAENGQTAVYDYVHDRKQTFAAALVGSGRLCYGGGKLYIFDWYRGLCEVGGDCVTEGATGACIAGNTVYVLRGGKLYGYYLCGGESAVRLPRSAAGKSYLVNVRERVYTGAGASAALTVSLADG